MQNTLFVCETSSRFVAFVHANKYRFSILFLNAFVLKIYFKNHLVEVEIRNVEH